jgi:hypothetical protein
VVVARLRLPAWKERESRKRWAMRFMVAEVILIALVATAIKVALR